MNASRPVTLVVAAFVLLAACGGDSGPVLDPAQASPTPDVESELPEALVGYVRPVEVTGDPLPVLDTDVVAADAARGTEAPVISGQDFDGQRVRIDGSVAGPTMVIFLAHWCPHCNDEIPVINGLRDEGLLPDGLNVVGVSTSLSPGRPNFPPDRWLEQKDWEFPAIADDIDLEQETFVAANAMGVSGFPFTVLIDGDGVVQARWSGGRPAGEIISLINANLTFG